MSWNKPLLLFCLLVFFLVLSPTRESSLIWRRHRYMYRWRAANIFAFARHSLPLTIEGPLACHTNCDTGHPFIMVISEGPWHLLLSVYQLTCHHLFLQPSSVGFEHSTFHLWCERSNRLIRKFLIQSKGANGLHRVLIFVNLNWLIVLPAFAIFQSF